MWIFDFLRKQKVFCLVSAYLVAILIFAVAYMLLCGESLPASFLESLYFSVSVATTLGFGDFNAEMSGSGQLLVVIQVLTSICLFGILLNELAQNQAKKQQEYLDGVKAQNWLKNIQPVLEGYVVNLEGIYSGNFSKGEDLTEYVRALRNEAPNFSDLRHSVRRVHPAYEILFISQYLEAEEELTNKCATYVGESFLKYCPKIHEAVTFLSSYRPQQYHAHAIEEALRGPILDIEKKLASAICTATDTKITGSNLIDPWKSVHLSVLDRLERVVLILDHIVSRYGSNFDVYSDTRLYAALGNFALDWSKTLEGKTD